MAVLAGVLMFIMAVILIAATSIGIQAFNNCADFKTNKKNNFNFLVVALVFAILGIFASGGIIVYL